jgi:CarD family transcriptional regulator
MANESFNTGFKIGDKAIYPSQGVGVIRRIESREIGGHKQDFYVMQIVSSGATVMVPTNGKVIRSPMSSTEIGNVYNILSKPRIIAKTTWNRRFREFTEKLRTGTVAEVAEVLRDLNTLSVSKDLSFGEKKMMERARELIVEEISAASAKNIDQVSSEIDNLMH